MRMVREESKERESESRVLSATYARARDISPLLGHFNVTRHE